MKTTRDRFMDAFLQKVSALPIVHQMVQEQAAIDESESLAERMRALNDLNNARDREAAAAKALENALSAKRAAEAKVKPLHESACMAHSEFNDASRIRQAKEQDYMLHHGEGLIHLTLSRLQIYRGNVVSELTILQSRKTGMFQLHGVVGFYRNDPETIALCAARAKELEARLATLDRLIPEATALLNAELSPHAIRNRADALIDAAGLKPSAPELATH